MKISAQIALPVLVLAGIVWLTATPLAQAATLNGQEPAEVFFTTVADRLLRQQFSFGTTNIPIAPTNEYSSAVHRLLQVAANLYDATRNDPFPSVFRPLFTDDGTNTIISGFTNDAHRSTLDGWLTANRQRGLPLVIGAKKGFPSFNEYTLRTDFQVTRKLELVRPDTNSLPTQTNQMYILGISNLFAMEAWNSYLAPYAGELSLEILDEAWVSITNSTGLDFTIPLLFLGKDNHLAPTSWLGREFRLPLYRQAVIMPPCRFLFQSGTFESVGTNLYFTETEDQIGFPVPDWQFSISNRFLYVLTDVASDRIVDFVISSQFNTAVNLNTALMTPHTVPRDLESITVAALWDTNRLDGGPNAAPTYGIVDQINTSMDPDIPLSLWNSYVDEAFRGMDKEKAIMSFRAFLGEGVYGQFSTNLAYTTALRMRAPFCPTRKLIQTTTWQANDPLVHALASDLLIFPTNAVFEPVVPPGGPIPTNLSLASVGKLNRRYAPWGGNPQMNDPIRPSDGSAYDSALKDPGVRCSDDWDFPVGQPLSVSWLGRIHRGTPWQTIYLKAEVATSNHWWDVSPDARTHPTNDWSLASLLFSLINTNPLDRLVSINDSRPSAWASVWDRLTVLSNNLSDEDLLVVAFATNSTIPFATFVMSSNSSQAAQLTEAVSRARSARPGHRFQGFTDFLTIPELSSASPWLNQSSTVQRWFGQTDAMLEAIPGPILCRLRESDVWGTCSRAGGQVQIQFGIWPGYGYDVESSPDLTNWTSLHGAFSVSDQTITVDAPADTTPGPRFYRAKLSPPAP